VLPEQWWDDAVQVGGVQVPPEHKGTLAQAMP
jgi:hypothetical protein